MSFANRRKGRGMAITGLNVDEVRVFDGTQYTGVVFCWSANIGFGELTIYKENSDDVWRADTEYMCKDDDKEFIKMVFDKWIEQMHVDQ